MTDETKGEQVYTFSNFNPDDTSARVKTFLQLSGDQVLSITIQKDMMTVRTTQPVDLKPGKDLVEILLSFLKIREVECTASIFDSVLALVELVVTRSEPRFFIVSPRSNVLADEKLHRYLRMGPMYQSLFGMLVIEDKTLDSSTFVVCGSSGMGWEINAVNIAIKGTIT